MDEHVKVNTQYASPKISRGKVQGSLDVSLAVMSVNKKSYRIDLDAGHIIYHIKVNSNLIWIQRAAVEQSVYWNQCASESKMTCRVMWLEMIWAFYFHAGKEPWTLLYLVNKATSPPHIQEERGSTGHQWLLPDPEPWVCWWPASEEWRIGDYQSHKLWNEIYTLCFFIYTFL